VAAAEAAVTATSAGHRAIDHTADLAFEAWGEDESRMLVEAARAVIEVMTEGAPLQPSTSRPIELGALDDEDRLVRWLNEVIWLATTQGFLVTDATLELHGADLRGEVRGEADAGTRVVTEVKAATYHELAIVRAPHRTIARFVLDV
jgi:SHS2 domain-containing protein